MWTHLKSNIIQVTLGSIVWIMLVTSLSNLDVSVPYIYFWRIIIIGMMFGIVFGGAYPYLWSYSTLSSMMKVISSTLINFDCITLGVKLYSNYLFNMMSPYLIYILLLTLLLHYIVFYFYLGFLNRKLMKELNGH